MLPPEYLEHAADDIVDLYSQLDQLIIRDIVRRIMKTRRITDTAAWQIDRVQNSGLLYNEVIAEVSKFSGASESQVRALFQDFGVEAVNYDRTIYTAAGLSPPPLAMSPAAQQVLNAGLVKTSGYLQNLTQTTASGAQQAYIHAATIAEMQVDSGAFDYTTAIRNAVRSAIDGGNWITYPTGHHDRLDVATRRAVMTGVNQTSAQISLAYADDMGCDLVETTAHIGARPEHAVWQGKVFSRSGNNRKYPDFVENTRYGYGDGLCGWNCRHNFYPYFEGISESAYPKQKLDEYKNKTVEYQGVKMSYYDATQRQRAMERAVRDSKRQAAGYDEAVKSAKDEATAKAMKQEFNSAAIKLKQQESILKDFTQKTGLERQRNLEQVLGFSHSQSSKAVWVNKKVDIQRQKDIIKEEIRTAGNLPKTAKIHLIPKPINTGSLSFDDKHINLQRKHDVTREQAIQWVHDAKISVTVWGGKYERYYGVDGTTYVNALESLIRTAYSAKQYDDNTKAILEVILKNGL
ncbi:phage minor capsid protein [Caproicibacterium sp. BJN0003]|uniref:phage minor capsid protein n=1 Tax=Caproicibacterium sp. BJN0003 TaxID=2994078 RepID=UPI00225C2F3E|nr:phage minor capsid protein [Caproicibacterium sp. BJN0003]UZT82911.1 phage minor capsid protein [Caproicibacterium sp. BJN0003]